MFNYFGKFIDRNKCNFFPKLKLLKYRRKQHPICFSKLLASTSTDQNDLVTNNINDMINITFRSNLTGHKIFLLQPYIKWGKNKKTNTNPNLQLEEAIALVNSLNGWVIVESQVVPLLIYHRTRFFGTGKLAELKNITLYKNEITAVFINTNMLSAVQHAFLEAEFQLPVYDRYLIIMNIFNQHAISPEAKLQVSLAEIPYLWAKVQKVASAPGLKEGGKESAIGGLGVSPHAFHETRRMHLHRYEQKLKQSLEKLRIRRESSRIRRSKNDFPIIAVVGYTNSGKTSLIKILTGSTKLQPKDQLFATLDVTFHEGLLPCNLKVLYVDTLGFITDIPMNLIEPFRVTLQDAMHADVILHIEDVSHPDIILQREEVNNTLKKLDVKSDLLDNIITVSNKIDLLDDLIDVDISDTSFRVSCKKLTGIGELRKKIEEVIIKSTGRKKMIIRAKTGGSEMAWLYESTAVTHVVADPKNVNYSLITVFITDSCLDIFKHTFIYPKKTI